jgi:hypothetical protein
MYFFREPRWTATLAWNLTKVLVKLALFEDNRSAKLAQMGKGAMDAFKSEDAFAPKLPPASNSQPRLRA